jgi:hypothetical protein
MIHMFCRKSAAIVAAKSSDLWNSELNPAKSYRSLGEGSTIYGLKNHV